MWWIYAIIYFVGVIICSFLFPRLFPYQEGYWELIDGVFVEKSESQHKIDNSARVMLWPLVVVFMAMLTPIVILDAIASKIYDNSKK